MKHQSIKMEAKRFRSQKKWDKKIKRISSNKKFTKNNLSFTEKERIREYWRSYKALSNFNWHTVYRSVYKNNGKLDLEKFIPEDAFYMEIEPALNNVILAKAYEDKNIYHRIFEKRLLPGVILRNINGRFYDENYNKMKSLEIQDIFKDGVNSFIVKPSLDTQKGKGIKKIFLESESIVVDEKRYSDINVLNKLYGKDFLVQENLKQHATLSNIYEYSLNTIRIVTLRNNDKIECISTVIRFGNEERIVDNRGIACGIDSEGKINSYATNLNMEIFFKHPYKSTEFSGVQIPNYEGLKTFVKKLHTKLLYFDLVSWDIAINEKGEFKMIEYNLKGQEINFHQINNGPLFGEHTQPVLKRVYN